MKSYALQIGFDRKIAFRAPDDEAAREAVKRLLAAIGGYYGDEPAALFDSHGSRIWFIECAAKVD